jgi:hypothetical protein
MISLELITKYLSILGNSTLNKVETKELLNFLREIQEIPQLIEQIQLELTKRFDNGDVNSYIELDDQLYDLRTKTFYHVIAVDQANSMELIELQKEIDDSEKKLDDYIDSEVQRIEDLCIKKHDLSDRLATEAKTQKAIDTDELVLVNIENNFYEIVKED